MERRNVMVEWVYVDGIPAGLPRLHTLPEAVILFAENIQYCAVLREIFWAYPRGLGSLLVLVASAFASVEGSDDEDNMTDHCKLDTKYLHINGNADIKDVFTTTHEWQMET
ncbi:hypothetical protein NC652_037226 [Populus alba x Populus x berolinensis]|nr:hypothetical protein NC652_037226 [Populus alba x Populus x berolinensis]